MNQLNAILVESHVSISPSLLLFFLELWISVTNNSLIEINSVDYDWRTHMYYVSREGDFSAYFYIFLIKEKDDLFCYQ